MVEVGAALGLGHMASLHCILKYGLRAIAIPLGVAESSLRPWYRVIFYSADGSFMPL